MNILITGTSGDIGLAIAEKFLKECHAVYGMDLLDSRIDNKKYRHIKTDILNDDLPEIPDVDILINCAGVQNSGDDIDINLKGTIRVTEQYGIREGISSILFIASKGGVVAYMKNTATRVSAFGATANSLSPGGVIAQLNSHIIDSPDLWSQVLDETMLGKWATCEEIADWAYFITVTNRSMTAQDILVDNGEAAKTNFIW